MPFFIRAFRSRRDDLPGEPKVRVAFPYLSRLALFFVFTGYRLTIFAFSLYVLCYVFFKQGQFKTYISANFSTDDTLVDQTLAIWVKLIGTDLQ